MTGNGYLIHLRVSRLQNMLCQKYNNSISSIQHVKGVCFSNLFMTLAALNIVLTSFPALICLFTGGGKAKLHCGEATTATHGRTERKAGSREGGS